MSRIARTELAPVAAEIRQLIKDRLGITDDFMATPAVLAELLGDRYMDSFAMKQLQECFVGNVMENTSTFLSHLYDALAAKGHGRTNSFEISSGDRYVSVINLQSDDKSKMLAFENQNFTYMVLLKPNVMSKYVGDKKLRYDMHVRATTPNGYGNQHRYNNPGIKGVPKGNALAEAFSDHGGYFRYLDARDRGFVASITCENSYKVNPDGSFTDRESLVWMGKDACASIFGGSAILDELRGYTTMWQETFEELDYKVVDTGLEGA